MLLLVAQGSQQATLNPAYILVQVKGAIGRHHQGIILASAGMSFSNQFNRASDQSGLVPGERGGTLCGITGTQVLNACCLPDHLYQWLFTTAYVFSKFSLNDHFCYKDRSTKTKTLFWERQGYTHMHKNQMSGHSWRPIQTPARYHIIYQHENGNREISEIEHKEWLCLWSDFGWGNVKALGLSFKQYCLSLFLLYS